MLLQEIHFKIFGENAQAINFSRARAMSAIIFQTTGCWISYKSLINFYQAACSKTTDDINPRDTTLAILVSFLQDMKWNAALADTNVLLWYRYRIEKIGARHSPA